jgi:hypothetical protein
VNVKKETRADEDKGEAYSMEDRLNGKDFLKTSGLKLTHGEQNLEWYRILVTHGETNGVFIPPWEIIAPNSVMGRYWDKKLLGETIHGRRRAMESQVNKLLLIDELFSKDRTEEYRDIIRAAHGIGYAALHNILGLHHPQLTERKIETKIPSQGISTSFGSHVRDIQEHLTREETRGHYYSKYEALQLSLENIHPSFHIDLKF